MVSTLPQVTVGANPAGPGVIASCSCSWRIQRGLRVQADIEAAEHRASHATPLHEDDEAPTFRIDAESGVC
jgi:hypothetical protein